MNFKIGDRVKCIDSYPHHIDKPIIVGKIYTIKKLYNTWGEKYLYFEEIDGGWNYSRFNLVKDLNFKIEIDYFTITKNVMGDI